MADQYDMVKDIGSGNFGVAKLMKHKTTGEMVAVKFIERGSKVDKNVEREILNHRSLYHPNIIRFKEVFVTPEHLAIVMEYAEGGELFDQISKQGRFSEKDARYYFQQLISGVSYCHKSGVCHRDLKLENTLLAATTSGSMPDVKICDFGYSKSLLHHSQPKSTVGTPAYIAPEVLQRKEYKGESADVWSCGVTLYVMLVGAYPFEDPTDPRNFRKAIQRIMSVTYSIPSSLRLSEECVDLLQRIFVADPTQRINVAGVIDHPWFAKDLPPGLQARINMPPQSNPCEQGEDDIKAIVAAARVEPEGRGPAPLDDEFGDDLVDDHIDECFEDD
eukprot:jgi/Tetstr1/444946/TSEL_032764.t1